MTQYKVTSNARVNSQLKAALPVVGASLLWLAVWAWSAFVVQPRSIALYGEKARKALLDAKITDADGNVVDLNNWLTNESSETLVVRLGQLNDASLFLRRLIDVTPDVSQLVLQLATASEASAQINERLSSQAMRNGDATRAEAYRKKAMSDSSTAQDMMERLSHQDCDEAVIAKAWDLARSLSVPVRDEKLVNRLVENALDVLTKDPPNRNGRVRLAQLRTHQAFSVVSTDTTEERAGLLREAIELISNVDSPSMTEQAFLAEAQDAFSPEQAIQTSSNASQRYWGEQSSEKESPEALAAVFGCLLQLGSFQEAQNLAAGKLAVLSPKDQFVFRGLCADFCVRRVVCQNTFPLPQRQVPMAETLVFAMRMDAQSSMVVRLLERLVVNTSEDSLSQQLCNIIANEKDASLHHLILSVRNAIEERWDASREEIRKSIQGDPGLSAALVPMVSLLVENQTISIEMASQFLDSALEISSEATGLYYASAVFFEKHERLEQAAECLEKILVQTNNDSQVLSILVSIYARLDREEDLKRIQLELQKLRKRPT